MSNRSEIRWLVYTLALGMAAAAAAGQSSEAPSGGTGLNPEEAFERLDADRDGRVAREEASGPDQEYIRTFDRDGDGAITREEANRAVKDAIVLQAARDAAGSSERGPRGRFERAAPRVGEPLPDLSGHDSEGEELRLSSLRGHYAVLVFGCLT